MNVVHPKVESLGIAKIGVAPRETRTRVPQLQATRPRQIAQHRLHNMDRKGAARERTGLHDWETLRTRTIILRNLLYLEFTFI